MSVGFNILGNFMQLVDSHCHLDRVNLAGFSGDFSNLVVAAKQNNVTHMLCVGIKLSTWPAMAALTEPFETIFLSVGVHPSECDGILPDTALITQYAAHPRVIAIGETGLDYHYGADTIEIQRQSFIIQIESAKKLNKPLIIHTRSAQADTVAIMRDHQAAEVSGVMHCFTEDWEMAKQCLDLGFYLSFSGIASFKNAQQIRDVIRKAPADRILIETDAPYLAPIPHRGRENHPAWVKHVAEVVAEVRQTSVETIACQTTQNFKTLFNVTF